MNIFWLLGGTIWIINACVDMLHPLIANMPLWPIYLTLAIIWAMVGFEGNHATNGKGEG